MKKPPRGGSGRSLSLTEKNWFLEQAARSLSELETLRQIAAEVGAEPDLDRLLDIVAGRTREALDAELVLVALSEAHGNGWGIRAASGDGAEGLLGCALPVRICPPADRSVRVAAGSLAGLGLLQGGLAVRLAPGNRQIGMLVVVGPSVVEAPRRLEQLAAVMGRAVERAVLARSLAAAERRWRKLAEHSFDNINLVAHDGSILYRNPESRDLLGYAEENVLGRNGLDRIHPDDRPAARRALAELVERPGHAVVERFRAFHQDGSVRWLESVATNLLDDPDVGAIVVNTRDVTERKQWEEWQRFVNDASTLLARSLDLETTLRQVAHLVVPFFADWCAVDLVDEDGSIRRVAAAHVEPAKEELIYEIRRRWPVDLQGTSFIPEVVRTARPVLREDLCHDDLVAAAPNQGILGIWTHLGLRSVVVAPLLARGQVLGTIALVSASAARRYGFDEVARAEELALRASLAIDNARQYGEARLRAAEVEALHRATRSIMWSPDLDTSLDCLVDNIVRLTDADLACVSLTDPSGGERYRRVCRRTENHAAQARLCAAGEAGLSLALRTGRVINSPDVQHDPRWTNGSSAGTGEQRSGLGVPIHDRRGHVIGVVGAGSRELCHFTPSRERLLIGLAEQAALAIEHHRQIKERDELEQQLRHAQKLEAIGQLAGGVAHDFNNLLAVIIGAGDLLIGDLAPADPRRELVQQMMAAADRATTITQQLRAFGRKQMLRLDTLDLNAVVRAMESMLRRLLGERIQVIVAPAPDPVWITADQSQLEMIIVNLAVNGRDAMPEGGILRIETGTTGIEGALSGNGSALPKGACGRLAVQDTGIGMDAATQARIFEPFFTTKAAAKGTGMGLAAVYGIVQQLGGLIEVTSAPGQGSTFTILLPLVQAAHEQPREAAVDSPARAAVRGSELVLLVEDEQAVRNQVSAVLQRSGYGVLEADSAEAALDVIAACGRRIDLLITDVILPGLSGRELSERLAVLQPGVKVLFMSGHTDDEVLHEGVSSATIAFLQKPFRAFQLLRKVREVLGEPTASQSRFW